MSLGIIGSNSIKKRENTVSDSKIPPIQPVRNQNNSDRQPTLNKDSSSDNILELNLKGVNLRLNEKMPFNIMPK